MRRSGVPDSRGAQTFGCTMEIRLYLRSLAVTLALATGLALLLTLAFFLNLPAYLLKRFKTSPHRIQAVLR